MQNSRKKHYSDSLYSGTIDHFLVVATCTGSVGVAQSESELFKRGHFLLVVLEVALMHLGIFIIYFNALGNIPYLFIQIPLLSLCVYVPIKILFVHCK